MTALTLTDREKSNGQTEWIVGRSPFFIAHKPDGDELWQSNRPYYTNDRIYKFPAGYTPTLEDVDEALAESGR